MEEREVVALGVDTFSFDNQHSPGSDVQYCWLGDERWGLENLNNLDDARPKGGPSWSVNPRSREVRAAPTDHGSGLRAKTGLFRLQGQGCSDIGQFCPCLLLRKRSRPFLMPSTKENQDAIHRIDPESSEEISNQFDELVSLLEKASDEEVTKHLEEIHHSDLADAFGLVSGALRKRLLGLVKVELDPDLLFELEDHLRKEVTDTLSPKEVAEVITEMDSDEAVQVLEDMDEEERDEILSEVPEEEREDIETGLAYPEESRTEDADGLRSVGTNWDVGRTIDYLREEEDLPDEFLDLFVVDEQAKPVGVISLSAFCALRVRP